jgi:hypothetical protein
MTTLSTVKSAKNADFHRKRSGELFLADREEQYVVLEFAVIFEPIYK